MSLESRKGAVMDDPGAEMLEKASSMWQSYGRIGLGVLGAIAVIAVVTVMTLRTRARQEGEAAGKLAEASLRFWQGDYPGSLQAAKQIAQQYAGTPSGADAHRLAGDDAFWTGDFKTAIAEYKLFLDKNRNGILADAARRSLAYALESDRQFAEAAKLYEGLVGAFDRESSAEFLAAAARCYRNLNQPAEAAKRLQRLVDEFGETSYASRARADLGALTPTP